MSNPKTKPHPKPQRDRFIETVRELECDEDEGRFNETLKRIAPKKDEARTSLPSVEGEGRNRGPS